MRRAPMKDRRDNMRMRRSLIKTYYMRRRTVTKDSEGGSVVSWGEPIPVKAIIWQASGHVSALQYGEKLEYIKNMEYSGTEEIRENDGICVDVDGGSSPDYVIKSVNRDNSPTMITLERSDG
jgi:hypothetical protein